MGRRPCPDPVRDGDVRARSRLGNDITSGYPELQALGAARSDVVLDGEIVALDERSRPSFQRLQSRMHVRDPTSLRRLVGEVPIIYMIFDLLALDGAPLLDIPYAQRRAR